MTIYKDSKELPLKEKSISQKTLIHYSLIVFRKAQSPILMTFLLILFSTSIQSCDLLKEPEGEGQFEEKKDTPQAKAEFMSDVVPRHLSGIATMDFDAVWVPSPDGKSGHYELQPKSMVDFDKAAQEIEEYTTTNSSEKNQDILFAFFYLNTKTRIGWGIPYNVLIELMGTYNLNDDRFDQYRLVTDITPDGGNPDASITKGDTGHIGIRLLRSNTLEMVRDLQLIDPYYFGK